MGQQQQQEAAAQAATADPEPSTQSPPKASTEEEPKEDPEATSGNITDSIQATPDPIVQQQNQQEEMGEIDDSDFIQVVRRSRKRKAKPDPLTQDKSSHDKCMKQYGVKQADSDGRRKNERKVKDKQRKHKDHQS